LQGKRGGFCKCRQKVEAEEKAGVIAPRLLAVLLAVESSGFR